MYSALAGKLLGKQFNPATGTIDQRRPVDQEQGRNCAARSGGVPLTRAG